jgi:hypothetical protein
MIKFRKRLAKKNNHKRVNPPLPPPPAPQGCGCGGSNDQRKNIVRKVINKRKKRN